MNLADARLIESGLRPVRPDEQERIAAYQARIDEAVNSVTAAGRVSFDLTPDEEHTGAMVALVPADPESLAFEDGEPVAELHVTLFYLGKAADIPEELQTAMLAEIGSRVAANWSGPIEAQVFGASIWNPTSDDPSLVLSVGGSDLKPLRDDVQQGITNAPDNVAGDAQAAHDWDMPEQHQPWVPHLCLDYDDPDVLMTEMPAALERVGPVTFDRVRVALADQMYDFPLSGSVTAAGWERFPIKHDPKSGKFMPGSGKDPDAPTMYVDDIRDSAEGHLGDFDTAEVGFIRDSSRDPADLASTGNGTIRDVSINEGIHTPQETVNAKRIRELVRNPNAFDDEVDNALPVVVRMDGKLWMGDGHHRAIAEMIRRGDDPPTFRALVEDG